MVQRKPAHQSWEGFVEQQIREAQVAGEFDHLSGSGEPLSCLSEPLDENWWIKRKLKEEQASVLPPLLQAKLDIQQTRAVLRECADECFVREEFCRLQKRVWEAIRSPLPSPPVVVLPVEVEREMSSWRQSRSVAEPKRESVNAPGV